MLILGGCAGHEVVLQIVGVHVHVGETATRGNVEVTNNLVHTEDTLNAAALAALGLELFSVSFPLTLLDVGSDTKGPLLSGICLPDFIASAAASGFDRIFWCICSVAPTAVIRIEMSGSVRGRVPGKRC
jgi:hypothetical protein